MKIEYINSDKYIIYLNNYYYHFDKSTIEKTIDKVLKILKKKYNFDLYCIFNIDCYICGSYGIILVLKKEFDPFIKYSKKTNINIDFYDDNFLFEVDDYFIKDKIDCDIYKYKDKYYLDLKGNDYLPISEHINKIIFGNDTLKIKI